MTKMVATVAALQLVEQGKLDLDAPIEALPPGVRRPAGARGLRRRHAAAAAAGPKATVKQLITHTSGLGYWFWNEDIVALGGGDRHAERPVGRRTSIFTAPLVADPGTRFEYGINTDWLGKVVEAASGKTLDVAIEEGITGPLGMNETAFLMTDQQRGELGPGPRQGRGRRLGWPATSISARTRTTGPAGTGCTRRRATT